MGGHGFGRDGRGFEVQCHHAGGSVADFNS
jgi:hypothetical protein